MTSDEERQDGGASFGPGAALDRARRAAAEAAIAKVQASGVGFYPGKIMAAYLDGLFDRSAAVQRRLCLRCNGTGTVSGVIDDDLLILGSWPCERCNPPAAIAQTQGSEHPNGE